MVLEQGESEYISQQYFPEKLSDLSCLLLKFINWEFILKYDIILTGIFVRLGNNGAGATVCEILPFKWYYLKERCN